MAPSTSHSSHRTQEKPLLEIKSLSIAFRQGRGLAHCVSGVDLSIASGELVALAGESGSGKTLLARSIPDLLPPGAVRTHGLIRFDGVDLTALPHRDIRAIRGKRIGMIFQEPMVSLNPSARIRDQILDAMCDDSNASHRAEDEAIDMLERLGVPDPQRRLDQYPHELSGGLRQRILIASVLLPKPSLVIADEPTTALDAINQREVLKLMLKGAFDLGCAVLLITHDLGIVADCAHRILVMQKGEIVESGTAAVVIARPKHSHTRNLLESLPSARVSAQPGAASKPWLIVEGVNVTYKGPRKWPWSRRAPIPALRNVSLSVNKGECVALVGESGSGKSTLGRAILGLTPLDSGRISLGETTLSELDEQQFRHFRGRLQFIFQDPYSSLNPRMRVGPIILEALRRSRMPATQQRSRMLEVLRDVGLDPALALRFPHQLSGGQRQRVGIARALITNPELVIADEPVAALDLTVQAQILGLLKRLQADRGFTMIFISHNLPVVSQIADRLFVMKKGRVVEYGPVRSLFDEAVHPYSRALIDAAPYLSMNTATGDYELVRHQPRATASCSLAFFDAEQIEEPRYIEIADRHFAAVRAGV